LSIKIPVALMIALTESPAFRFNQTTVAPTLVHRIAKAVEGGAIEPRVERALVDE
jgi:hypothetical protein